MIPESTPARHVAAASTTTGELVTHGGDALDILNGELERAQALADECRRFARDVSPVHPVQQAVDALCNLLRELSEIEEDLVYPAARAALCRPQLIDIAALEHATARHIIHQMQTTDPCEARYEALLVALSDCVERHAKIEQGELFPLLRGASLDLAALGERMCERRAEFGATH